MTQEQYYWFIRRPQMLRAANIAYGAVTGCGSTSPKKDTTVDTTTNDQSQNTTPTEQTPTEQTSTESTSTETIHDKSNPVETTETDTPTNETNEPTPEEIIDSSTT